MHKRVKVIVGHYGSGKTEFSLNYAAYRAGQGERVALADLDIVNPYFRSREKRDMLQKIGILVTGSSLESDTYSDVPALTPQLLSVFENPMYESVIDVGGDPVGARVLGRFYTRIPQDGYEMWMVVNANRPETQTAEQVINYMYMIEQSSRLKVSGIINNTHLVRETGAGDILRGDELCSEVSQQTGIPLIYTCINKYLDGMPDVKTAGETFNLKIFMRPYWM